MFAQIGNSSECFFYWIDFFAKHLKLHHKKLGLSLQIEKYITTWKKKKRA